MDDEIRITPNRTREMRVVIFRETVMTERLGAIPGAFQTFQEPDL